MSKKKLSDKQCRNRLTKYFDKKYENDDIAFYGDEFDEDNYYWIAEKNNKKFKIVCNRTNGKVFEI